MDFENITKSYSDEISKFSHYVFLIFGVAQYPKHYCVTHAAISLLSLRKRRP